MAVGLLAACAGPTSAPTTSPGTASATPAPAASPSSPVASPSPTVAVPDVDIEVMIGRMMVLGFRGTTLEGGNPVLGDLVDRHVGTLLLYSHDVPSGSAVRNITSPAQLTALCAAVQRAAPGPVLLCTDEEGGEVARLSPANGFPATTSAASLGAQGSVTLTRAASAAIATTLAGVGIRFNLAPVVDVDTNPDNPIIGALHRSFSADPAVVSAQAEAFVQGHRDHAVLTSIKHFPGHGSSTGDTHLGFVDVTKTWQDLELDPYRALLAADAVDSVMVAHVFNARLDPLYPASLSTATISGLLREKLGFAGVVVSDDLQMRAITSQWSRREAIRRAVLAGNDLLTFSNNIDVFEPGLGADVHATLLGLVADGSISEDRIAESYRRVSELTARVA